MDVRGRTSVARYYRISELRNVVERSLALGLLDDGAAADAARRPAPTAATGALSDLVPIDQPLKDARQAWMLSFESVYARRVLERAQGNVTRAAEMAGVSWRFLQRLLARLGIAASAIGEGDEE